MESSCGILFHMVKRVADADPKFDTRASWSNSQNQIEVFPRTATIPAGDNCDQKDGGHAPMRACEDQQGVKLGA